ncbi:g7512 [Coccomyxa elongata]
MEVGEEERYACAALFTLALHATQVDYGASNETLSSTTAWGAGDEDEWEAEASRAEELKEPSEAVWAAFWGWDCCGPGGILDRLYTALKIPERSWSGLKRLPEVGGLTYERRQQYLQLVSSFLQVLDSTLPAAHVTSRSYRALSDTSTQRPPASRTHIGYLPKVDDMLGLTEPPAEAASCLPPALPHEPDGAAAVDPFAASMHVLPQSVPGSLRDAQSGRKVDQTDGTALAAAAASGGEDVGLALKERETEMLLDDSDSELEADLVFAHVMSRRPGAHAMPQPEPTAAEPEPAEKKAAIAVDAGTQGNPLDPKEDFREGQSSAGSPGKGASRAGSGAEPCDASPRAGAGKAEPGEASQQTQAINSNLMSSMIHSSGAQTDEPPGTSHASLPPMQSVQVADSPATRDVPVQSTAHAASVGADSSALGDAAVGSTGGDAGGPGEAAVAAQLSRRGGRKRAKPSHKAVAAMWELLESCIAQPQPKDPTQGESKGEDGPLQRAAAKHPPRARWYDARSRIALRRVASWLNVPWLTVANFEHLLAYQLLLPPEPDGQRRKRAATAWENSIWAAKIGATTVGIGALFALTGGLAAPAIASGIGAAITMAGGGAAAAAGATGFLATTAGTAAVVSSMGVAGGSYAGTHMARRIGNVKEFGFWEVNESTLLNIYEVPPPEIAESLKGSASLDAPGQKEEVPGASPSKAAGELRDGPQEKLASMGKEDNEQGWASSWEKTEATPQAARPEHKVEANPTFSPRGEPDDFLSCRSPNDPKPTSSQSRSSSVAVELRELQPSSHTRSLMDMDPPLPDPDVGHISFAAIPRMGPACVSVTSTSERSPRPAPVTTQTAASPATEHASSAGPQLDEQHCAEDSSRATSVREASTSRQAAQRTSGQAEQCGNKCAGPSRDGTKKDLPGLARGNAAGSSASLDSMGEPKNKRGAPDKDGKRWLWKPKFKEPPLLLAPISPHSRTDDMRMSLTIGVNGWIGDRKDYLKIWASLKAPDSEVFTLVWESKELLALNTAIVSFMAQQAYQEIAKFTLTHFFYTGLVAAFATPWLLVSFSQMIDHAWVVALDRAQKAGVLLAHTLMAGGHGDRPVILVGYSMGARLIFHCLLELCRHNAKGVVEHVVLMGVPVSTRVERWAMTRSAVAGRFVNAYSRRDWVLGLIYRGANGFVKGAGGLCPMKCPGIENINLTSIIAGHFDYISKMPDILDLVGIYG